MMACFVVTSKEHALAIHALSDARVTQWSRTAKRLLIIGIVLDQMRVGFQVLLRFQLLLV